MKNWQTLRNYLLTYTIIFLIGAVIGEFILRARGIRPIPQDRPSIRVTPGNTYYQKDTLLGYRHLAGQYDVTLKDKYTFRTTHDERGLRLTHPSKSDALADSMLSEVWLMGCSFTHGWSVNDEETFAWQFQAAHPEMKVINFGMSGFGTIHSYLQLQRELLQGRAPHTVVLAYANFHQERNILTYARRRTTARWNFLGTLTQPFARLDATEDTLVIRAAEEVLYNEWWLSQYSSLAFYLQSKIDLLQDAAIEKDATTISEALLLKVKMLCKQHDIRLVIANIWEEGEAEINTFCQQNAIEYTDISVNLAPTAMTNLPYDGHPSAKAHNIYAEKLNAFFDLNE